MGDANKISDALSVIIAHHLASARAEGRAQGLEMALAIVTHPNAGLDPPDVGSPTPREMLDNIAAAIRAAIPPSP